MSNITSEGQQKEIRGGQGAELLLQYDFGRTANIEITDALVSMGSLEYLFGGNMTAGTFKALRRIEGVVATANTIPALPLTETVVGGVVVIVIRADGTRVKYPATGEQPYATINALNAAPIVAPAGSKYILWYESSYTTAQEDADGDPSAVREMILKASDFPPTVRFVGETVVLDADKGKKIAFIVEVPKFKLNANFTLSFDAEGDPSVFDFSGVALSHNGELLKVKTLGFID
jgi:hypothetical protein